MQNSEVQIQNAKVKMSSTFVNVYILNSSICVMNSRMSYNSFFILNSEF
jgi:hypothetical protein